MTLTYRSVVSVIALNLAAFALPRAHAADVPKWYVGATGGQADFRSFDDHATAWSVDGGLQINRWLAVEAEYVDFGKIDAFKARGVGANVIGSLPIYEGISLYGKAGLMRTKATLSVDPTLPSPFTGGDSTRTSGVWGAGARWQFAPNWSANLEWARYQHVGDEAVTGRTDIDLVMAGVRYTF